jgi:hypothetical protein
MTERKHSGGRQRTGSDPYLGKDGLYRWRGTVGALGSTQQKVYRLETADEREARIKVKRLLTDGEPALPSVAAAPITVAEFADKWIAPRLSGPRKKACATYESRYLDRIWKPAIGHMTFDAVRVVHIEQVLDRIANGESFRNRVTRTTCPSPTNIRPSSTSETRQLVSGRAPWRQSLPSRTSLPSPSYPTI